MLARMTRRSCYEMGEQVLRMGDKCDERFLWWYSLCSSRGSLFGIGF